MSRALSTFLVVVLALSLTGAMGWMVGKQFAYVLNQLPEYRANCAEKLSALHLRNPALKNASAAINQINASLAAPMLTFALFGVIEATSSYVVEPLWYGTHTGVSPLTVCLVVLGRHIPHLGFLALLLGHEAVLAPEVHIYQRLLAAEQEEARQVAESLLSEKPLLELYDSVLAPVMSFVEQDRKQGQIDKPAARMVCQSMREIIDDLAEINEKLDRKRPEEVLTEAPAPRNPPHNIVGVPAQNLEEEIIALMLCQLLDEAGQNARTVPHGTPEEIVRHLQSETSDIICISALSPGVVSHTRFLYRNLRSQFPRAEIILGVWGFTGDVGKLVPRIGIAEADLPQKALSEVIARICHNPSIVPAEITTAKAS